MEILKNYSNYLVAIEGYSEITAKGYFSDLMNFFAFIKEYKHIDAPIDLFNVIILKQVKKQDIIAYLIYLNYSKDNKPATRKRKIYAIKNFYNWLINEYLKADIENPAKKINPIQKLKKFPKYLSLEQAKQIQQIFTLKNSKYPLRNNAIISLFLSTGIRRGELININIKDVNFNEKKILVLGKGKKEREVYFSEYCKKQLEKYIEYRKRKYKVDILDKNTPLFLNKNHKRLKEKGVEQICHDAYKLIGLEEEGFTAHTLRHTAATLIYKYVKPDPLLLKNFLGHESISTTQIYTHVTNQKVKEAVERNPLSTFIE